MLNSYPNPWVFTNDDENLSSYDNKYKIEYCNLSEIAQGSPLGGKCYLKNENHDTILLNDWCSGPIIWENKTHKVALPIWRRKFLRGIIQQIVIANLEYMTLTTYKNIFNVLHFESYEDNMIYAIDSPIYKMKPLKLNVSNLIIESVVQL